MNKHYCIFRHFESGYIEFAETCSSYSQAVQRSSHLNSFLFESDRHHYVVESFWTDKEMWDYIHTVNDKETDNE